MSGNSCINGFSFFRSNRRATAAWALSLIIAFLFFLAVLPGCSGCRKNSADGKAAAEKKKKEEEEKKPPFTVGRPSHEPSDQKTPMCCYKPGHWTSLTLPAQTNNFDLVGKLQVEIADRDGNPIGLEGLPYSLVETRDVALSKGQPKLLHSTLFVPKHQKAANASCIISGGAGKRFEMPWPLSRMPSYQYHFAVLSQTPDRYAYLRRLDSIKPPRDTFSRPQDGHHYRVELLNASRRAPLPAEAMFWTSIAYVLWDDIDPQSLTREQQQALVDWLHWGGQLIVSGPTTLEGLRGSFLEEYLPASADGNLELTPAVLEKLNSNFAAEKYEKLVPAAAWAGVKLKLAQQSRFTPGVGKLFAERRVGRGRVVVSAIRLSDRDLTTWQGFDNLFNACLLRREPRQYIVNEMGETELVWADRNANPFDAARTCQLRYFTRDTGIAIEDYGADTIEPKEPSDPAAAYNAPYQAGQYGLQNAEPAVPGGVAAWRNFCPVANHARAALQNAARVEIPGRMFVVWIVGLYLLILVPLNWSVFGALGRVEWAWAAAPFIAVACTPGRYTPGAARYRFRPIGIGAVGYRTPRRIAQSARYPLFGPLHFAYDRIHRSSQGPGRGGAALPGTHQPRRRFPPALAGQGIDTLYYDFGKEVSLRGFTVRSNLTGLLHSEQMAGLDGPLLLKRGSGGRGTLHNHTGMDLRGTGVVRRDENGQLATAWVGTLYRSQSAALKFHPISDEIGGDAKDDKDHQRHLGLWPEQRDKELQTQSVAAKGEFNFSGLVRLAEDTKTLEPGDCRLIAWTEGSVPGVEIEPAAPQSRGAALVVANLCHGFGADPRADVNSPEDVKKKDPDDENDSLW